MSGIDLLRSMAPGQITRAASDSLGACRARSPDRSLPRAAEPSFIQDSVASVFVPWKSSPISFLHRGSSIVRTSPTLIHESFIQYSLLHL
jgi:hypothetical protein